MSRASVTISAENTWSPKFHLAGDGAGWPRRALVCYSGGSTVTIRRYNAAGDAVIGQLAMTSTMSTVEVPISGMYDIGVATGGYVNETVITVEQ